MTQTPPAYDIFLSYASADEAWVDGYLLDALRASGLNVLTAEDFQSGRPLLAEYERAVVQSRYVVLVLSPAWTGDRFGEFVDLLATFHGNREGTWPVVPLILQPAELPLRLAHLVPVDATTPERWPAALEKIAHLLDAPLAPAQEVPNCPYPGMTPFTTAQESLFFGRDREIADAVDRLRLHPFLCVIGPSGSGKSSLVYAGVIPALGRSRQSGSGKWDIRTLRPGAKPLTVLADTLNLSITEQAVLPPLRGELEGGKPTLLFIDQFEELFTQSDPSQVQLFLDALQTLIGQPNLHILLTVRADFYPELMGCTLWPAIQANRLDLPPLGRAELALAIVQPAAQVSVSVDPLLVERLTGDAAGEKGALPLVQECLRLLWQGVARRYLPAAAYAGMAEGERNGLQIAIDRRASVVYNNLPPDAQSIARRIFLRLIQFGEGRADTRRQVAETDLWATGDDPTLFGGTLQTLIDRRLLTTSGGEGESGRRVDIAHEALIAGWALLRGWIDDRRTAEQTRRRLEATAQRWEELERAGGLLDPVELAEAQRWLAQPDSQEVGGASSSLAALIEASETRIREEEEAKQAIQAREIAQAAEVATLNARRETEQAQARRRTLLLAAALLSAVVVIAVVGWFWRQSQISEADAVAARQAAKAGELAGQALAELDLDAKGSKALALLLARESVLTNWRGGGYVTDAAMFALNKTVRTASPWLMDLTGHSGSVWSAAFSPDGSRIVTASEDSTAKVWNAADGAELFTLSAHTAAVWSAAFSPDGQRIVTASEDSTAKVWNAADGTELFTLSGHTFPVHSATFSSDGQRVVTAGGFVAKVWNVADGTEILNLSGHVGNVNSAAFSSDGFRIVTASFDQTAKVWDVHTGNELLTLSGHTDFVNSATFSRDGQRIVTASYDGTAKVWDAANGTELFTLSGHTVTVHSAVFSSDGQRVVTAGFDGTAKVWDAQTGSELLTLSGHTDWVRYATFSSNSEGIVTASEDKTAKVWNSANGSQLLTLSGHSGMVRTAAFSSDGERIVTASYDGTAKVWNAADGTEIFTLSGHSGSVRSATFNRDGERIITASGDYTAIIWNAADGSRILTLSDHTSFVNSAAFSGDDERIVTAVQDRTAKVWNAADGSGLFTISGHSGPINFAAFSNDGERIVTASADQSAKVWGAQSGSPLLTLSGHSGAVRFAAFSPDGSRIITASDDQSAKVWDAQTGNPLLTLFGHSGAVNSAVFSPDGGRIVTASDDNTAKVWDATTGTELLTLAGHTGFVNSAAFSPDGQHIVTASSDRTARIWLMPDALLDVALRKVQRDPPDFTSEEKARYGIGE